MKTILQTERLRLRQLEQADHAAAAAMLQDIRTMYAWERTFSEAEVTGWIERMQNNYRRYGYGYWLAVERSSGQAVGQIGLLPETIDGRRHLGVGYLLRQDCRNRGYATEGARACVDYAFRQLAANRVIADIRPENHPSRRVAERLGMRVIGEYVKQVYGKPMLHLIYEKSTPLVRVLPYDPQWQTDFRALADHLAPLLAGCPLQLEHVGSTAVPGLAAKPVIDADLILADWSRLPEVIARLQELGFRHVGDYGLPGREAFTRSLQLDFMHNLYVCRAGSQPLLNHLRFRDYLRRHPAAAGEYGDLKRQLAREFPDDIDGYCRRKSDFIAECLLNAGLDGGDVAEIRQLNLQPANSASGAGPGETR